MLIHSEEDDHRNDPCELDLSLYGNDTGTPESRAVIAVNLLILDIMLSMISSIYIFTSKFNKTGTSVPVPWIIW